MTTVDVEMVGSNGGARETGVLVSGDVQDDTAAESESNMRNTSTSAGYERIRSMGLNMVFGSLLSPAITRRAVNGIEGRLSCHTAKRR